MQISLITPLFNRLELTRACIESVRRTLAGIRYEWIIVDDGSTDGTREFLDALAREKPFRVILNDTPRGFAANNNVAARLARAPLLCLLNNDTVVMPGWLDPMTRLARLLPDVGFVGNVQREVVSGSVDHAGIFFDREATACHFGKDRLAPPREDYLEWPAVTAACCVIRRRTYLELGGFDEAFRNGSEDIDFCLRAGQLGYRHFVANRSVIYHHVSASPGRLDHEGGNQRLFRERWLPHLRAEILRRRSVAGERAAGRAYLWKHFCRPWRLNFWSLIRALQRAATSAPPSTRLDLGPRLLFAAQDFIRRRRLVRRSEGESATAPDPAVYLVVGDTAQTADRSRIPTFVRSLAAGCGRTHAPVGLAAWRDSTQSLCVLPEEYSLGLDAEGLRRSAATDVTSPSAPALVDPGMGYPDDPLEILPALHGQIGSRPIWVVLPEVLYRGRTEQLLDYVRRQGWRSAVILHDTMANNEPRLFPLTTPHAHEDYLRAISRADMILPVSSLVADDWARFAKAKDLSPVATHLLPPGADTFTRARPTGTRITDERSSVRVLCVSSIEPRKNQRTLIEAFELVRQERPELDFELTFVGEPQLFNDDNVPEALRQAIERHAGRLRWFERVEYSALGALYEKCDFTVFPSLLEGIPLPVYESLWFCRPCLCANTGAMNEAAIGGGCVTVDVTDAHALAAAIIALAESPKWRAGLAEDAARRSLRTWDHCAVDLLAILRDLGSPN